MSLKKLDGMHFNILKDEWSVTNDLSVNYIAKFLTCQSCNSLKVEKTLMAPQLIKSKSKSETKLDSLKHQKIKKTIKTYQKFIKDNFQYVGDNFAYEARSIHYNNKKKSKGIYGNASKQDLRELKEEGIDAQMIPWIEDKNN